MPPTIRRLLDRLRLREQTLAAGWAAAKMLALFAALLAFACLLDWWVDRRRDTPDGLRFALRWGQVFLWVALPIHWVAGHWRRLTNDEAALAIEAKEPSLGHRLISAVQLNRPGAQVVGMSPELIDAVTRQAEEAAAKVELARVSDGRRYRWAAGLTAGVAAALGAAYLAAPFTVSVLLARQVGYNTSVPRALHLKQNLPLVWPSNEENTLRLTVFGDASPDEVGEIRVSPAEGEPFRVALHYESDGVWAAKLPPMDTTFTYLAWLGDGRTPRSSRVSYTPRPVVESLRAAVLLPTSVIGLRPDGQPYEEAQRGGDVDFRLPGSSVRVNLATQTPIWFGEVRVKGERPRVVPLVISEDGLTSAATFALEKDDRGYDVVVRDRYQYENNDPPRRAIRALPIEPPEVALLPETLYREGDTGEPDEREIEGIPALVGHQFALAYEAKARYGLSHAMLRYRVIPKSAKPDQDASEINLNSFRRQPIGPPRVAAGPPSPARLREFATLPAEGDGPPDVEGGGRCDFGIASVTDGAGGVMKLQEGDRVQFYVEVFGKADPNGTPGRSAVREKEVVDLKALTAWLERKENLKERTRLLEEAQRTARPRNPDR